MTVNEGDDTMADVKNRHGCLTAWLILMIVMNSATALMYLFGGEAIRKAVPNMPAWMLPVFIAATLFNLACAIALFHWKKWGFWGFCVSSVIALVVNLSIGSGIGSALTGLLGMVLLYGVLHIGKENKGWTQLD